MSQEELVFEFNIEILLNKKIRGKFFYKIVLICMKQFSIICKDIE